MRFISWNIDGALSVLRKTDFRGLMWMWQADIYAFQETKLLQPDMRLKFPASFDYWSFCNSGDTTHPRSGTVCFCKKKPRDVYMGIGDDKFDTEGRIITLEYDHFFFVNCYIPQSQDAVTTRQSLHSMERRDYRARFDKLLQDYIFDLNKEKPVIICGDFNAAISKIDMSPNSRWQDGQNGFSKDANDRLRKLIKSGFTDTFRYLHPKEKEKYTHWSLKDNNRDTGTGRRLDYFFVSDDLAEKIQTAEIYTKIEGSDHCPIYLNIDLSEPVIRGDVVHNLTYDDLLMREKQGLFFNSLKDVDLTRAWETVDWDRARAHLRELQRDIVLACFNSNPYSIRNAQFRLVVSLDAKLLAVKSVTSRDGKAGVDGIVWRTPNEKMHAALELTSKDYRSKDAKIEVREDEHGKLRNFNIDTYHDRAMQTLYGYSLAPIAEVRSDRKSFSNRKGRSTFDVNYYIVKTYSGENAPLWAVKTDIEKCYESIDHDWLKEHIQLADTVLDEFLRAGYFKDDKHYESYEGIGIGSRLSPYLANMCMDGLQEYIYARLNPGLHSTDIDYLNGDMIRFADDILISARDRDTAKAIIQIVRDFMRERHLSLSTEKTQIIYIPDGFDFIKRTYSKNGNYINAKPSEVSVTNFRNKLDKLITNYKGSQARLIEELNKKLLGYASYHRITDAAETFHEIDVYTRLKLFELCEKRSPNTWSKERIISEYWYKDHKGRYAYALKDSPHKRVMFLEDVEYTEFSPIPLKLNPYLDYEKLDEINKEKDIENVNGDYHKIWSRQEGLCEYCKRKILPDDDKELIELYPSERSIVGKMAYIHSRCKHLVIEFEEYKASEREDDETVGLATSMSDEYLVENVRNHPLFKYFREQEKPTVTLSFKKIGDILGEPLSEIAYERSFWLEDAQDKLCRCWLDNNYYVKKISTEGRKFVTFHRFRKNSETAKVKIPDILIHGEVPKRMKYEIESTLKHIFEQNGIPWE